MAMGEKQRMSWKPICGPVFRFWQKSMRPTTTKGEHLNLAAPRFASLIGHHVKLGLSIESPVRIDTVIASKT
jgi:hypothetical protein